MQYCEYPPHPALTSFIRVYWSLCGCARHVVPQPVLPDGSTELVIHRERPFVRHTGAGPSALQAPTLFVGQMQAPVVLQPAGAAEVVAIRFRPNGAYALLGTPQAQSSDAIVDAEALGVPWLRRAVRTSREAGSVRDAIERLERSFLDRVRETSVDTDPRIDAAVRMIDRAPGRARVDAVALATRTSRRQLERLFHQHVGLSPKVYARIVRFQAVAARLAVGPDVPLAATSYDAGYFDQSHMIREFLAFAGHTPGDFRSRLGELTRAMLSADERR